MTLVLFIIIFFTYMALGMFFLSKKFEDRDEEEMRKENWSVFHGAIMVMLWPYFCLRK